MFKFEKKFLEFIEKNIFFIILIAAFLAGAAIRLSVRNFVSEDAYNYLLEWYNEIKACGGLKALDHQVGNYNVLYQTLIALFTYLPIPALFAYKGLSIVFDLLLACLAGFILYKETGKSTEAVVVFSLIWLSPVVFFNSSFWAQCDSIYTFFVVLSLYLLYKEKHILSFVVLGVALSFKLQAVFILPFFLFMYFYKKKFSILHFLITPAVMWVSTIPAIIAGRSIFTGFSLYFSQTDEYGCVIMNYPSFLHTIAYDYMQNNYKYAKAIGMVITVSVLAFWMIYVLWSQKNKEKEQMDLFKNPSLFISFSLLLTYTTVFMLPAMHDRYGFLYEILAILYMFRNKKSIIPCIALQIMSVCTYSNFLFHVGIGVHILAVINFAVYAVYCYLFTKELKAAA
ncbi:MAG: glycosyltransferase 87 family protein [Lachnospiraceae bacterium]|nr:glycosyltransferase 87 family protein [Lachnospiraceae bacterium]